METKIKTASVKVMLSYDYCHFEVSMSLENETELMKHEIDSARKDCQRLADKAVRQYKTAKEFAAKREDAEYRMHNFRAECERIEQKNEQDRTIREAAMLKQYQNEEWESQFKYEYDYDDED